MGGFFFAGIAALFLFGFIIYYSAKKKQPVSRSSGSFISPSKQAVNQLCLDAGYDKEFLFELTGTHVSSNRKFFENEAYEYLLVDLIREPKNKNDPSAIAVKYEGKTIGYVPKSHQKGVSSLMNREFSFCFVKNIKWRYDSTRDYEYLDVTMCIPYKMDSE